MESENEADIAEQMYWDFDARRKGDGPYKGRPQSERDAFKQVVNNLIASHDKVAFKWILRSASAEAELQKKGGARQ